MLIGILATIIVPNFRGRLPAHRRQEFVSEVEALITFAQQNAITSQKVHRVLFDFQKRVITVEQEVEKGRGKTEFKPIKQAYQKTAYHYPESIEIKQFFINGVNEMQTGKQVFKMWIFILPSGLAQEVIINAIDTSDQLADGSEAQLGLVLNPFTARLKVYDTFAQP